MHVHDWEMILKEAGDDPIAPSAMQLMNRYIDADDTVEDFWLAVKRNLTADATYGPREEAFHDAARTDLATKNLIATYYGEILDEFHMRNAFHDEFSASDIRRFFLLTLITERKTEMNVMPFILALNHSKDPLLSQYSINTDEGLAGQEALVHFSLALAASGNKKLRDSIFSAMSPNNFMTWFGDSDLVECLLTHPERVDLIAHTVIERDTTDMELIRSIAEDNVPALAEGQL